MQAEGVYQTLKSQGDGNSWLWRCKCGVLGGKPMSREAAREAYKEHRLHQCSNNSPDAAVVKEDQQAECVTPPADKTQPVERKRKMAATKKKTKKTKATAKKAAKKAGKKKAVAGKKEDGQVWRFGFVKNAKGKQLMPRVQKNGMLPSAAAERLGMEQVPKWGRIRAKSRQDAIKALKEGKGEFFTPSKGE